MQKQLLIYEKTEAVNKEKHAKLSIEGNNNFGFAQNINAVPVTAVEFPKTAQEFAIVFAGAEDDLMPFAVLSARENENDYLKKDNTFDSKYIPAFLRRYPFVFSSSDDGENFTLCVDSAYKGCNKKGKGERLFDSKGEHTTYLNNILDFLKDYQVQFNRTKELCKKLSELKLLEPMTAEIKPHSGEKMSLTGFYVVNREKIKELSSKQLAELTKTDELELLYLHIQSLNNFDRFLVNTSK